jgi:type II secretion system protein J
MTHRSADAEGRRAGFTLVEVVLALVIFGFIALTMYSAFFTGQRAVIKGEHSANVNQRMRVVEDLIGRQIRSAVFYFARSEEEEEDFPFFLGMVDRMTFVSAAPQSRGGTGLAVITYRVVDGRLELEERVGFTPQDLYDPPNDAVIETAVLLPDVSGLRFEYIGREDGQEGWQSSWDAREEDVLPAAVRMTIENLEFFEFRPWIHEIPLMTVAYGWGDDFQEPPDEDDEEDDGGASGAEEEDTEDDDEEDED